MAYFCVCSPKYAEAGNNRFWTHSAGKPCSCFAYRYVFSADVARALHEVNAIAPLKFMPNEDATFGFWVMGMDLRHVDQPM